LALSERVAARTTPALRAGRRLRRARGATSPSFEGGGYDPGVSEVLDHLTALVARLRRDCPWDREQTFETLQTFLLEETYEVLAAVDAGDPDGLREELGDLLFQVFFLSRLAEERGWFSIGDVADGITRKMTERHPHVFGEATASTAEEVKTAWEKRKRRLPGATDDPLGTLPAALPALAAAYRQTLRAADLGFDWERDSDVVAKIEEEIAEWREASAAGDADAEAHEIGDLLLSLVNLARRRRVDPESALRAANARFRSRFAAVARKARESGKDVSETGMEELDRYWEEAKKEG
jgi:MazG family protein